MAVQIFPWQEVDVYTHVYMKQVVGVLAGATQLQIDLSGELNVYLVQVKLIKVYSRNF